MARVAVLWHPPTEAGQLKVVEAAARSLGAHLLALKVERPDDFVTAFAEARKNHAQALIVLASPFSFAHRAFLVELAAKHLLPAMYFQREFVVNSGGLMSYGPDGEIGGLGTLQDPVHVRRGAPVQIASARTVAHEPSICHKSWEEVHRGEPAPSREVDDLRPVGREDGACQREDCVRAPRACGSKGRLNVVRTADVEILKLARGASGRRVPPLVTLERGRARPNPQEPLRARAPE
jgi:hypothetical protein